MLPLWQNDLQSYQALDTTLCDQVCQWLETGQWFSQGTAVSSTNKTDHYGLTGIFVESGVKHHYKNTQSYTNPLSGLLKPYTSISAALPVPSHRMTGIFCSNEVFASSIASRPPSTTIKTNGIPSPPVKYKIPHCYHVQHHKMIN